MGHAWEVSTPGFHARDCLFPSNPSFSLSPQPHVEPYMYFGVVCNVTLYSTGLRMLCTVVLRPTGMCDVSFLQYQVRPVVTKRSMDDDGDVVIVALIIGLVGFFVRESELLAKEILRTTKG